MTMSFQITGAIWDQEAKDRYSLDSVTVTNDVITSIVPGNSATDAHNIDCSDLYVLPGLIDAHAHLGVLSMSFGTPDTVIEVSADIMRNAKLCLSEGFTTVRDVGGVDGALSRAISRGLIEGPRILPSGPILTQTGGHADRRTPLKPDQVACCGTSTFDGIPGLSTFALVCDGADQVTASAREAFRRGATQIKMCLSGGIVSHSDSILDRQFSLEEIRAAVSEASARGTYVTAHAFSSDAILRGVEGGCKCIEHGSFADDRALDVMASSDVALVPTLSTPSMIREKYLELGIPESVLPALVDIESANESVVSRAEKTGVRIGLGSDLIGREQGNRLREVGIRAAISGFPAAIRAATQINAGILGQDHRLGRVETGYQADLIGIRRIPGGEEDPLRADDVRFVMKSGVVVKDLDGRSGRVVTVD